MGTIDSCIGGTQPSSPCSEHRRSRVPQVVPKFDFSHLSSQGRRCKSRREWVESSILGDRHYCNNNSHPRPLPRTLAYQKPRLALANDVVWVCCATLARMQLAATKVRCCGLLQSIVDENPAHFLPIAPVTWLVTSKSSDNWVVGPNVGAVTRSEIFLIPHPIMESDHVVGTQNSTS